MATAPGIGAEFAGYRIERLLGRGGVGLVYLAQDLRLPRHVALKILAAESADDPRFRERFIRESKLAASIDHHNIVPIFEAGEADGVLYIAMRYVAGTDLRKLLVQEGPLDPARTVDIIAQVASALDAAHAQSLVHRDVKPGNILIVPRSGPDTSDHAYLADFGITKRLTTEATLTAAGQFVGTTDYVAPEQIMGAQVDGRADIYSLGCVFFECLVGAAPFERDSDIAVMYAHLSDPGPLLSLRRPGLPRELDDVVAVALAKKPEARYQKATAFAAAARAALRDAGAPGRAADVDASAPTLVTSRPPVEVSADAPTLVGGRVPPPTTGEQPTLTMTSAAPPASPPPPLPPASPATAWEATPGPSPAPPGTLPLRGLVIVIAIALIAAGGGLALVLSHRGTGTGSAAQSQSSGPATGSPAARGALGMLLSTADFPANAVSAAAFDLRLADVGCGATPANKTEEHESALGASGGAQLGYFSAVAAFAGSADAQAYIDAVDRAQQGCSLRLAGSRAAPRLGQRTVRVLFTANDSSATYDAIYIDQGRFVSLVMVSNTGTTPPPQAEAEKYAAIVFGHMIDNGA